MARKLICLAALFVASLHLSAQQTHQKYSRDINYLLYLPDDYGRDTAQRFPLMLFLHGSGESGTDLEKVKVNGPPKLIQAGKKFPFIVVSPQADPQFGWEPEQLYHLLLNLKQQYRVDASRVYLTGLSMGGFGTWALGMAHPEEFAAIVPICGGGDTTHIFKLRNMPVRAFHGAKDNVVSPQLNIGTVNALKKYNPSAKITIYPEANHNSWEATYNNDSLYTWLLSNRKFNYRQVAIKQKLLDKYAGSYTNAFNDTIQVISDKNCLMAHVRRNLFVELKPAADDTFFINETAPVDLKFEKRGKQEVLIVREDEQMEYRKVK